MKDICTLSRRQLLALPSPHWNDCQRIYLPCLILIPTKRKHDSGYLMIAVAATSINGTNFLVGKGRADVININEYNKVFNHVSIDLLPKNGLFRVMLGEHFRVSHNISSFRVVPSSVAM